MKKLKAWSENDEARADGANSVTSIWTEFVQEEEPKAQHHHEGHLSSPGDLQPEATKPSGRD